MSENYSPNRVAVRANAVAPVWPENRFGYLSMDLNGSLRVTGGGGGGGGTSSVDESAFTEGVTSFTPTGGVYDDTLGALTQGDLAVARLTAYRAVAVNLREATTGAEIGTAGAPIRNQQVGIATTEIVDSGGNGVTVTGNKLDVNASVTIPSSGSTGAAVPASASYDGINVGGTLRGATGSNPTGTVYSQQVDLEAIVGTVIDVNSGNKSAGSQRIVVATDQPSLTNPLHVDGIGAANAAVSGNPVRNGGLGRTTTPTAVTADRLVDLLLDRLGRTYVISPVVTVVGSAGTPITTATTTTIVAAPSAGNHLRIHRVWCQNAGAAASSMQLYWCDDTTKRIPVYLLGGQPFSMAINGAWELTSAKALQIVSTAVASSPSVEWYVEYETLAD